MRAFSGGEHKSMYNILLTAGIILLAAGVTAGSVYLVKSSGETLEGIKTYITDFFSSISESSSNFDVFKNSMFEGIVCFLIIFVMGFFRFGFVVTGALLVKKGFVTGYAAASFIKLYGFNGIVALLATMPSVFITVPAMLFFSAVSVIFSLNKNKKDKKMVLSYIFLLFVMTAIFCVSSLTEGYLTTTFMKLISSKIL